jgi:hypothetical protein
VLTEKKKVFGSFGINELAPAVVYPHVDMIPVIKARAFDRRVRNVKTQGPNQVKTAAGARAEPGNRARVLRNDGAVQNDMKNWVWPLRGCHAFDTSTTGGGQ